jgi:hypothetical protein
MAMLTQVQILISTRDEDGEVFRNNRPPLQISHTSVKQEVVTATGSAFTASNPLQGDLVLTLGASPSLGIANGNATDRALTVVWFV